MMQIFEYIRMALANIRMNKGRSILTMLGIIIGISSVITIKAVGDGFEAEMNRQLNSMAQGQLYIFLNDDAYNDREYLNGEDMDEVGEVAGVTGTSPDLYDSGASVLTPKGSFEANINGGGNAQLEVEGLEMARGRFYDRSDISTGNRVCLLSSEDARRIFGTDDVVGLNLETSLYNITVDLRIIGIVKNRNTGNIVSMGSDAEQPVSVMIPYTTFESFGWETTDYIYGFYVTTDGSVPSGETAGNIVKLLNLRHHAPEDGYYRFEDFNDQMAQINSMMGMITGFISLVAGISLLVGGIGVMNIMLVSVTERTREIGIRKALGARTRSIMLQFLSESAIIACIGGIIGIVLGLLLAAGICSIPLLGFRPGIRLSTILFATLFSSGIGIFFGIHPARKAAKMNPIEALRRD